MKEEVPEGLHGARPGNGKAVLQGGLGTKGADRVVRESAKPGGDLERLATCLAGGAVVLVEDDVEGPVERVLNAPMQSNQGEEVQLSLSRTTN